VQGLMDARTKRNLSFKDIFIEEEGNRMTFFSHMLRDTFAVELLLAGVTISETPGVTMAGISTNATPPRNGSDGRFEIKGRPGLEQQTTRFNYLSPEYFSSLRVPLLRGRIWTETEN
jgi:hypothetical protein